MLAIVRGGHEVTAIAADNDERHVVLRFACRNSEIGEIWLSPLWADYLLRYLERVMLGGERDSAAGSRVKTASRVSWQRGPAPPVPG
jgi:hypothetical protein